MAGNQMPRYLAAEFAGAAGVVWWGRRHRGTPHELVARRGFAVLNLLITVGMQIYWLTPDVRTARNSWPLQLSDLVGLDTLLAIADSLYEEFRDPALAAPAVLRRMTEAGLLGRKSGRGFYEYEH